ncbi:ubiquitin hydrolase B-like [Fundulus diaphanus]
MQESQIEYTCHCGAQQSSLQRSFSTLPNVLILHLKRFIFTSTYTVKKIKNPIALSRELVVKEEFMANKNTTARYSLVGVVSHMGSSADSGHYICDSIHRRPDMGDSANSWLTYDDERVSQTTGEDVCRRRERIAFLLFYEKQGKRLIWVS